MSYKDFTRENYCRLLVLANSRFRIIPFRDFFEGGFDSSREKTLVLRHDVDHSVHSALEMARMEQELGICSTYFIHLHSNFYHPFEKEIAEKIIEIKGLGHEIGLHFDSHFFNIDNQHELDNKLKFEKTVLENYLGLNIQGFSFHNTTPFTDSCGNEYYGGLYNVYSKIVRDNFKYCSDSNGYWRFDSLEDVIMESGKKHLHVLTHPGWWESEVMPPKERIMRKIFGRAQNALLKYEQTLKEYGRRDLS